MAAHEGPWSEKMNYKERSRGKPGHSISFGSALDRLQRR